MIEKKCFKVIRKYKVSKHNPFEGQASHINIGKKNQVNKKSISILYNYIKENNLYL